MLLPSFLRAQLYAIAALGVLASSLAVFGMLRVVANESGRKERARDALNEELTRLAALPSTPEALREPASSTFIGMRAGFTPTDVPDEWRGPRTEALGLASQRGARSSVERDVRGATLLVVADPSGLWAGVLVRPGTFLSQWRLLAVGTLVLTILLVALTSWSALTFRKSAAESERANRRLTEELSRQERLAALGRVAAGVAHEVRNPLAAIKLRLDLAAAADALPAPLKETLSAVSAEVARLDRLVSDLLLVAGRKLGPKRRADLRALVDTRVDGLTSWASSRSVVLRVSGAGEGEIDPESFTRALDNVLRNAIEAAPAGSEVRAAVDAKGITVEDAGGGVDPGKEAQLFEPFFTTKPEGTGLGLAISRSIARAHGGELSYVRVDGRTCLRLSWSRS